MKKGHIMSEWLEEFTFGMAHCKKVYHAGSLDV